MCPPKAALEHVVSSQGWVLAHAHLRTSRCLRTRPFAPETTVRPGTHLQGPQAKARYVTYSADTVEAVRQQGHRRVSHGWLGRRCPPNIPSSLLTRHTEQVDTLIVVDGGALVNILIETSTNVLTGRSRNYWTILLEELRHLPVYLCRFQAPSLA